MSSSRHSRTHSHPPPPIPEGVIPTIMTPTHEFSSVKTRGPSGLAYTWRLWRHCCCRYGWYPLIIAPFVTAGCLLSLYSAVGCDFVRVDIGFTPSNESWNQSTAEFGLFQYQSGQPELDKYREAFVEGCRAYGDNFSADHIDDDRTWKVARTMAYISGIASTVGMVTSWLFVISPLPAFLFWPGVLLPSLMAAFLAEGSKFLLFDTSICRNAVWFPSGTDSLPRVAEDCSLGTTSFYSIAAGSCFFVSLLLVCLKAPEKRILDSDYGTRTELIDRVESLESPHNSHHKFRNLNGSLGENDIYSEDNDFDMSRASSLRDDRSEMQFSAGSRQTSSRASHYSSRFDLENPLDSCGDSLSGRFSIDFRNQEDDLVTKRLKTLDGNDDIPSTPRIDESLEESSHDDRYSPQKPTAADSNEDQSVSESRLHAAERLRVNSTVDQRDLIERFMNEVNHSFAADEQNAEKKVPGNELKKVEGEENESQSVTLGGSVLCAATIATARSY